MSPFPAIDGIGVLGNFLHYGIVIALVGSAFFIFIYLWKKNRLDMDEEPKFQMMHEGEGEGACKTKKMDKQK